MSDLEEIKLTGESKDIISENVNKLKEIFPEVITEEKIDFKKLELILGKDIDDSAEKYSFTWPGKTQAIRESQKQSTGTLRPCKKESEQWSNTQNLYIEGDNLEVLKLLQKSYYNKIKAIYIDPPYNTGRDLIYEDNYKDNLENYLNLSGQLSSEDTTQGIKLTNNPETEGRYHTKWLNMMYPRLKLARNLLTDDGLIFISIDDNELINIKKMCDEIFGEENFISNVVIETANGVFGSRASQTKRTFVKVKDYVLVYIKNKTKITNEFQPLYMPTKELFDNHYSVMLDENLNTTSLNDYLKSNKDIVNLFKKYSLKVSINNISKLMFLDEEFNKIILYELADKIYQSVDFSNNVPDDVISEINQGKIVRFEEYIVYKTNNGKGKIRQYIPFKDALRITDEYVPEYKRAVAIGDLWKNFDFDMKNIDKEGNTSFKNGKKPVRLIKQLLKWLNINEGFVLDFFSGSATTADAVFQLNSEKNANLKFILIQIPETIDNKSSEFNTICDLARERIIKSGNILNDDSIDTGFKYFQLDSSNLKKWEYENDNLDKYLIADNIKSDRTNDDLIYEIMLKYGVDLTLPVVQKENNIYSIGYGALIVCLEDSINKENTKEIANKIIEIAENSSISRVVFKDSSFNDGDSVKTNIKEIFSNNNIDEFITI